MPTQNLLLLSEKQWTRTAVTTGANPSNPSETSKTSWPLFSFHIFFKKQLFWTELKIQVKNLFACSNSQQSPIKNSLEKSYIALISLFFQLREEIGTCFFKKRSRTWDWENTWSDKNKCVSTIYYQNGYLENVEQSIVIKHLTCNKKEKNCIN